MYIYICSACMLVVLQKIIKIQLYNTVNMIKMSLLKTEMLSNNYSISVINQNLPWLHQHSFITFSRILKFVVEFVGKLYLNLRVIAKLSVQ